MIVVADTGPLNYLVLTGYAQVLPRLYGSILIPPSVHQELSHPNAPASVRAWAEDLPPWANIKAAAPLGVFEMLGRGETEALALALAEQADFVLMDESQGRNAAIHLGIAVKGTLGVLEEAASKNLIDLAKAIETLRETGIFLSESVVQQVLKRFKAGRD